MLRYDDACEDRFRIINDAVVETLNSKVTIPPAPSVTIELADGTVFAEVKETARALTIKLSKTETPEFVQWMRNNAETELIRLYEAWQSAKKPD